MHLPCLFHKLRRWCCDHAWVRSIQGVIPGAEAYPPGSGAILPPWIDIEVRMYHCGKCGKVEAVAYWIETTPYKPDRNRNARLSVAWALWQLRGEAKK